MSGETQEREAGRNAQAGAGAPSLTATILALSALAVFLYVVRLILIPFVIAGAVAYILSIFVDYITARTRLRRQPVAALVFVVFLGLCAALGAWIFPRLSADVSRFTADFKGAITAVFSGLSPDGHIALLGKSYSAEQLADQVQAMLREWIGDPSNLITAASFGASSIFAIFLAAVILFYFLMSGREIVKSIVRLAPPRQRPLIWRILTKIDPLLRRYFIGVAIIASYAGIAAYIGLGLILGVRHAVLLAIATGFLEMIPVAGPFLAAVLAGIVALQRATGLWSILEYVIYASALRLSIDQLFGPIVLGRAASLSPVTIIFCFLSGGILYGIVGVILSVPVALSIRIALQTIYGESQEA